MKKGIFSIALLLIANASADDGLDLTSSFNTVDKAVNLPSSRSIVMFHDNETVVVTDNPRYVVKGELFDMWKNEPIQSRLELKASSRVIPLESLKLDTSGLFEIIVNEQNDKTLTVFIDPTTSDAPEQVHIINKYASAYRLRFVFTSVEATEASLIRLLTFACDVQTKQPSEVVSLILDNQAKSKNSHHCQQEQVIKTYAFSQFLNIRTLPTVIASNGVYSDGMPVPFIGWLAENME
ncbi:hypothetical protein [Vibrio mediterranei]|uniref:hypothetical protein n=1 Tax=Vibrio mediterranei TaxID=689 RepID=UPI0040686908